MEGEEPVLVRVESAGVFDDVDVFGGPAGGYVGEDDLLEEGPLRQGWVSIASSMGWILLYNLGAWGDIRIER